jgi:deoxyribodipyrimidine photolyase-related protein
VTTTALVLGDQLMRDNPALDGADRVLLVQSRTLLRRAGLHRRRAHLVLSGMRHLATELREQGRDVTLLTETRLLDGVPRRGVVCAHPNRAWARDALRDRGVELVASNQFLTAPERFAAWADDRGTLRMEDFYRDQRRAHDVLLDADGSPVGGRWNFDEENRRPPPRSGLQPPEPWAPEEDAIDAEVRRDLDRMRGLRLWGEDGPRRFAVTPDEARRALRSFVAGRLPDFGPWQDAMVPGERTLFHSLLSVPMNLGVLEPLRAVRAAERAHRRGDVPIASAEGFIRQIIGWREYVWGMYWLRHAQWPRRNALRARMPLPAAYREGGTGWNCLDTTVAGVREDGYAHHIERLMVLGVIGLTAGVQPWPLVRWFARGFVDGAEWVMAPNAAGMGLFADGGEMMTKPYAAGGNYIDRMSGHCRGCRYRPSDKTGDRACPVTALYWDFVDRHRDVLAGNRRTRYAVRTWDGMDPSVRDAVHARARAARRELRDEQAGVPGRDLPG